MLRLSAVMLNYSANLVTFLLKTILRPAFYGHITLDKKYDHSIEKVSFIGYIVVIYRIFKIIIADRFPKSVINIILGVVVKPISQQNLATT
jgi:hypothetical protein